MSELGHHRREAELGLRRLRTIKISFTFGTADGMLERVNHPVEIAGKIFDLKLEPPVSTASAKHSRIYFNLTSEPTSKDWFKLRNAKSCPQ
jgi:hypothetical protein